MFRRRFALFSVPLMGIVFLLVTWMNLSSDQSQVKKKISLSSRLDLFKRALEDSLTIRSKHENLIRVLDAAELAKNLTILHEKHMRDDKLPQKCKIPVLDPYHPDVKPFIKRWSVPDCKYPELSEVTDDGLLRVSGHQF